MHAGRCPPSWALGHPEAQAGDSAWLLETCRPQASLGWRLGVSPGRRAHARDSASLFLAPAASSATRLMDFGAGVPRGAEWHPRQRIPRGCLALPSSPAVPEAINTLGLLLSIPSLQLPSVSRRLLLESEQFAEKNEPGRGERWPLPALAVDLAPTSRGRPAVGPCRCPRCTDVASAKCRPSR